jgi:(+)-trans-carveol dehydrogenase
MGRVEGKVAFITGAARGQGRAHAIRLAEEGADIIALDLCGPLDSNIAEPATPEDLAETVKQVEALDRRIVARQGDVRDLDAIKSALDDGLSEFGHLDIVCANAGSWTYGAVQSLSEKEWQDTMDVVLTGTWHTVKAVTPTLIEQGTGGSIILTSSVLGLRGQYNLAHYVAAKHGVVGLMQTTALELAQYRIRVNAVNPGIVNTKLVHNPSTYSLFAPDIDRPAAEQVAERMAGLHLLGVPWVEPEDVAHAVLFLASDESRYITGISLPIDAGSLVK